MNPTQKELPAFTADKPTNVQPPPASWWEGLCCWLTTALKGMEMTLERREGNDEWKVECLSRPLESVTTHSTPNGIQVLSISAGTNGKSRIFEIAGPDSIMLSRDPAGFPVRVEMKNQEVQVLLCFSGPIESPLRQSSNAWGE
jgi:hypothetical protein